MQGAWWYLVGDSPQGPVSIEELEAMLHHGEMTEHSLVWKEGLSSWISMEELLAGQEIASQQVQPARLAELAPAGAWRRFLARGVDLCLICLPLVLLGGLLAPMVPGLLPWLERPSAQIFLALYLLPLVLLVEAGIFAGFGTTPGKALLGIVVMTLDGERPSAAQYLRRQLGVYCYGFALGLPVISLIAMAAHGLALQQGEPTPYDAGRFTVRERRLGRARVLALVGLGCALAALGLALLHQGD